MTGTWVNVAGIVLGALIGCLLKKGIPQRINAAVMKAEGVAILIIALNGILTSMLYVEDGAIRDTGGLLLLISLVLGCLAGELLRLDDHINGLGLMVENKLGAAGFARGFISASLIFGVGAMSIIGPLNDGLTGDSSVLFIKSTLDFTTSIVLASTLGIGVLFSFVPVLLFQGAVALLAGQIAPYVGDGQLLNLFCMVGYTIVMCIGFNFVFDAKIKTANLLPSLVVPVAYYFLFL